jgi:transposase
MDRDEAAKKKGYSANSYIDILEDQLPTIWSPGMLFMQDNASIYTAKIVKDWFDSSGISVLEWPPYSPDLNPIEIVWAWLKEWITTNYPKLINMGASSAAYQRLYQAMRKGWESIS